MEGIENLPNDCLQSIFNHLSEGDLEAVSVVCKDFLTNSNLCKQRLRVIHPEISRLSAHVKRFKGIEQIDLRNFAGDTDKAILEIARSELQLKVLHIPCGKGIKTECLKELGSNSKTKNLKVLKLHMVGRLQDNDLVVIANSFPELEELKIGYKVNYYPIEQCLDEFSSWFPTDQGVEFLASKLKCLKKINFSGKYIVSDRSLAAFSLSCLLLKEVKICCDNNVTENGIGLLLRNVPNLEVLSIKDVKPSQSTITIENSISHAKALTSLELCGMTVSNMLLNAIGRAKLRLKKFGITYCGYFTAACLFMVLGNYQLTELRILGCGCRIVDQDMNILLNGDISKLTRLEIIPCQMTKSSMSLLSAKCPSLEGIKTNYDADLRPLIELGFFFPNVKVLELTFWQQPLTTKTIKAILKSCKFLRKLALNGYREAKVPEPDNSELLEVNLEDLKLSYSSVSDEGLAEIAKICPRLVSLDLSYSQKLPVESVKQILKKITTLNCLHIGGRDYINSGILLEWMLSTGNLASLKKIYVGKLLAPSKEQIAKFFHHGCLLFRW